MTCIVALEHDGKVYMGGDSAGVGGYNVTVRADPKVFKHSGMIFGFTTSFRMGNILHYNFEPPVNEYVDTDHYMYTDFINSVRATFKENGFLATDSEGREAGGTFIVGIQGKIYTVQDDFQIQKAVVPYDSVGSGYAYSLGYLYATAKTDLSPRVRVRNALKCAEHFNGGVRGPFKILSA